MTRKELLLRQKAALAIYKDNNIVGGVRYAKELFDRNMEMKFYRFRPAEQYEIDAIDNAQIYLCRPKLYEDQGDCEWIDDLEALVKYDIMIRNNKKYGRIPPSYLSELSRQVAERLREDPKYINLKNRVRNMCLVACITDKVNASMWKKYAVNCTGVCLEYDVEDVFEAIRKEHLHLFPIWYVDDRKKVKDIQFGPDDYAEEAPDEKMMRKYILSCLTKNKIPYSCESEWRILCVLPYILEEKTENYIILYDLKKYILEKTFPIIYGLKKEFEISQTNIRYHLGNKVMYNKIF